MAFGFGFNKQKALSTAEKYVQQGKLQNAISEYEKVLKSDPKDLTVLNTVGDLYSRLGQGERAVECFKSVGDAYASQGFTVKAIAMYKKLSKLKPSLDSVLRLAELYTQQGLFNDARAQYRQVAEEFLRTGELEQAARIFQKTLEMDPENVAMRTRLAEVYVRLGKKTEAWQIFAEAAETLRSRGATGPAEELLQRMLTLDPGNSSALLLRARIAFDSGDLAGATQNLEKIADLDTHPDGLRILLQTYVRTGRFPEAATLASKLISIHNDTDSIVLYADALVGAGRYDDALQVYAQYSERLLGANQAKVLDALHAMIGHVRDNTGSLETLLGLLNKAGESTHITEVYELLAHGYAHAGQLDKARGYYLKLTELEPQNQLHSRNYQQVMAQLGSSGTAAPLITAEEGAVLGEELEASAPFIEQRYPDDVALTVRGALTDAELFVSYNMPAKALDPLLAALPKAPRDLRLNQRLTALHTRAGRFADAAACCRVLESLYHEASCPEEATRYGELAEKYEQRAAMPVVPVQTEQTPGLGTIDVEANRAASNIAGAESTAVASAASSVSTSADAPATPAKPSRLFWHARAASAAAPAAPAAAPETAAETKHTHREIDISEEWEGTLVTEDVPAASAKGAAPETAAPGESHKKGKKKDGAAIASSLEEIRFYLAQGMVEQAQAALSKLEESHPEADGLAPLRAQIEAAAQKSSAAAEDQAISLLSEPAGSEAEPGKFADSVSKVGSEPWKAATVGSNELVSALQSSRGIEAAKPSSVVAAKAESAAALSQASAGESVSAQSPAAAMAGAPQTGVLGEFVADLESSLGDSFLAPTTPASSVPAASPKAAAPPVTHAWPTGSGAAAAAAPAREPERSSLAASAATSPAASAETFVPAASTFTYQSRPVPSGETLGSGESAPGVDLSSMFGELKEELENDTASTGEDPETHYNLGVAFREMGLLDEAIGELQKVCQAVDRGHPFPQLMQTYTWLAQCFLDKGVPEAAIRWYEKALTLPGLDADARLALHYELASSYESANNRGAALTHFLEVYGTNIDYRDVAERIKALKS